jgi:LuxR family maltose regulon positive regulatory protein
VAEWLRALPEASTRDRPWLAVASAWVLVCTGHADEVGPDLEVIRRAIDSRKTEAERVGEESDETRRLEAHLLGVEAHSSLVSGDFKAAESLSRRSIQNLRAAGRMRTEWTVLVTLVTALRAQIQLDASAQLLTDAMRERGDLGPGAVWLRSELGETMWIQGRLTEAAEVLREALEIADAQTPPGGAAPYTASQAHIRLSGILREWNELEPAIEHARLGVRLSKRWGQVEGALTAHLNLSRTLHSAGRPLEADRELAAGRDLAERLSGFYVKAVDTVVARRSLQAGDTQAGLDWVETCGLKLSDSIDLPRLGSYYTLAYIVIAVGRKRPDVVDLPAAADMLRRLAVAAGATGANDLVIRMRIAQAMALDAMGLPDEASRALTAALELGEPEGYVRAFVDEGDPVAHLLYEAVVGDVCAEYAGRLLAQFEAPRDEKQVPARTALPEQGVPPLIEPLSSREVEVLALMADGLSDREIAQRLSISVNTVKKHNSNVFGKLAVHSRTRAVARARQMGILE